MTCGAVFAGKWLTSLGLMIIVQRVLPPSEGPMSSHFGSNAVVRFANVYCRQEQTVAL